MELRTLSYFLTVAREQNMTEAANVLHVTQPTLSRQIADLEDELGKKLDLVFRMLRATIMHLPIDADKKAEIINERGGK